MLLLLRWFFFDVIMGCVYFAGDVFMIWFYLDKGDGWWAGVTIWAVCMPGLLEFFIFTIRYLRGRMADDRSKDKWQTLPQYLYWVFFSACFPVSVIAWHFVQICKGESNLRTYDVVARSRVLNNLQVLTKSMFQMILQMSLMMITWYYKPFGYRVYLGVSCCLNVFQLAYCCTNHYYFESSGKKVTCDVWIGKRILRLFFNIFHVFCRCFVYALLCSYMHFFTFFFFCATMITTFTVSCCSIETRISKAYYSAAASIMMPNCFIWKEHVVNENEGRRIFARYHRWQAFIFYLVTAAGGGLTANLLLHFGEGILNYDCESIPIFSYNEKTRCPEGSMLANFHAPRTLEMVDKTHVFFLVLGTSIYSVVATADLILTWLEDWVCIHDFTSPLPHF